MNLRWLFSMAMRSRRHASLILPESEQVFESTSPATASGWRAAMTWAATPPGDCPTSQARSPQMVEQLRRCVGEQRGFDADNLREGHIEPSREVLAQAPELYEGGKIAAGEGDIGKLFGDDCPCSHGDAHARGRTVR